MSPDVEKAMAEVETDIRDEINTVLPGTEPLKGLHVEHEGGLEYAVLSSRNGCVTHHYVTIGQEPSCTCGDFEYNRTDDREVCAHIAAAVLSDQMEPDQLAVRELVDVTSTVTTAASEAREAADLARDAATEIDTGLTKVRDTEAEKAERNGHNGSETDDKPGAIEKAEELQNALDDVIDGMETEANAGKVWINITPDAPEELPGPGSVSTFNALLRDPDQTQYAPDDQSAPGEYFKNRIDPDDVNEYISEVLE